MLKFWTRQTTQHPPLENYSPGRTKNLETTLNRNLLTFTPVRQAATKHGVENAT